jgi:hypothetical protein
MTARKRPFDIDKVILRIRAAVRPFPKAAMFELADDGFNSPYARRSDYPDGAKTFRAGAHAARSQPAHVA